MTTIDEIIQSEDAPVIDPSVLNLLALLSSSKQKGRRRDHKAELLMLNSNGYSGNNDRRRGTSKGRKGRGSSRGVPDIYRHKHWKRVNSED